MIIMRKSAAKNVQGHLVEILQTALNIQGFSLGKVDGDFGGKTETAVKHWQGSRGLGKTGVVTEVEWRGVTGMEPPSLFDRTLQVLAAYEGTGFDEVVGNFDGAFVTFGLIGFTLKHDMPNLLAAVDAEFPTIGPSAFGGARWKQLLDVSQSSNADKEAFGNSISVGSRKYHVIQVWRDGFNAFGRNRDVQRMQLQRAFDGYYSGIALRDARRYGATTVREVGLFFDTAIQNGGVNSKKRKLIEANLAANPGATGDARMKLIATGIADGSAKRWREDVLKRRNVFATGEGVVHGSSYKVVDWGLEQGPVDLDALANDHITSMPDSFAASAMTAPATAAAAPAATAPAAPVVVTNIDYLEEVPLDPSINGDLRSVSNRLMLATFGQPRGDYNQDCQPPTTPSFRALCDFGVKIDGFKWKVWGLKKPVTSLKDVVADIKSEKPEIFEILDHMGMGCCRHQRGSSSAISNHSWGSAIDLTLHGKLDKRGNGVIQRGILEIAPIFNRHLWYSGAVFRTEDAMHMEISRDWLEKHYPEIDRSAQVDLDVLDIGDRGARVQEAQRLLQAKGFDLGRGGADGIFGTGTLNAVRAFQGANALGVDGRIGESTLKKLRA